MSRGASATAALLAAALGCAGAGREARPARPEYRFPPAFDANQVVTVTSKGETHEFLASVRRDGRDQEVTLFDPALAVPVWSGARRAGVTHVEPMAVRGRAADEAAKLLDLLDALWSRTFRPGEDGSAEASAGWLAFRIRDLRTRDGCEFPDRIEVSPKLGSSFHVEVVTADVGCRAPRPPDGSPPAGR